MDHVAHQYLYPRSVSSRRGDFAYTHPRHHNYKQTFGAYRGSDDILPAMGAVRRAVLSPDDLLGYKLFIVRSHCSCCSMPNDNNVNLSQVLEVEHHF